MKFEDIPVRMLQLGVDREWLAQECDYSLSHIGSILAPNGDAKAKTQKALRRIWEALDREEARQKTATLPAQPLIHPVTLTPSKAQFDRWMKAAYRHHDSFDDWAKAGLDQLADEENAKAQVAAEDSPDYPAKAHKT